MRHLLAAGICCAAVAACGDGSGRDEDCASGLPSAGALLVVGSSLAIYSGLRFVHAAAKRALPVCIVTLGETRADPLASLRIDAAAGATLDALAACLLGAARRGGA